MNFARLNVLGILSRFVDCIEEEPGAPEADEVLVEMLACPINSAELLIIEGRYASKPPLPARLGESTPVEARTFWFTIRCTLGEPRCSIEADLEAPATDAIGALKILVAEDNHVNQMLVAALLGKAGHRVEVVGNGLEAVQAVQVSPYDLVFMDVQMPEMDGPTATKEIRQLPGDVRDIPIIALTANAMAGHRDEYLAAGMNDYVSKPIEPTTLFEAIARTCGHGNVVPEARDTVDDNPDRGGHEELDAAATEVGQALLGASEQMMPCGAPEVEEARPELEDENLGNTFDAEAVPLFDEEVLDQLRGAIGYEVFQRMLILVPGESERLLSDIQWALGKGDLTTARQYAHSLKGMAGNYAATRIATVAREFEIEAQTLDAAREKTAGLERAIEETQQWLEKFA